MADYKGYIVGDIIHYYEECDPALGIIKRIGKHNIVIDWIWAENNSTGVDYLEFDDFDELSLYFKKITEQEKLIFLLKND
jgi:hypothetical protein